MSLAIVGFVVLVGAFLQRVSGMGMGLVAGPVLAVILGPVEGILVVNAIAVVNAVATTLTVREHVNWKNFAMISSVLIIGVIPGAWLVSRASGGWLQILVGVLLLIALAVTTFGKKYIPQVHGVVPMAIAGALGGFMNTLAGIAGPAITVYAQAARWDQRMYAATLQPIFFVAGLLSFGAKVIAGAGDLTVINPWIWPVALVALSLGIFLGVRADQHTSRSVARNIALSLATLGGITAIIRGAILVLNDG